MFYKAHPLIFKKAEELRNNPTYSERLLWNYIRENQFGIKFRRQHPASIYVLDFYAHKIKLAIEIDGDIHSIEDVKKNDLERQRRLESLGIQFLRFSTQEVEKEIRKNNVAIEKKPESEINFNSEFRNPHESPVAFLVKLTVKLREAILV